MDKYIEIAGEGFVSVNYRKGNTGNIVANVKNKDGTKNIFSYSESYPCPQPHPFKDGENVTGKWEIKYLKSVDSRIAVPIQPVPTEQPKEQSDGWVRVEDGLPDVTDAIDDAACLCYDAYHMQIRVLVFSKYHHCWDDESGDDYYTDAVGGKVTHWQPLPPPPKH